jgi:hypothetical protein
MELLRLEAPLEGDVRGDAVLVIALDGWTDAGLGGTTAAEALRDAYEPELLGAFDSDALYDYRDRRPQLAIDRGILADPEWPELLVERLSPPSGPPLVLITGPEPDLGWRALGRDLVQLAERVGARRYVGLGSVPGPIPHTRPVQLICTSSDPDLADRIGRAHEQVIVPASCQVAMEALLAAAGLTTVGLWARVPHYVAGEYPEAARVLLEQFTAYLGTPIDLSAFEAEIAENRAKLDVAATSSDEVTEHVAQLERLYDAELEAERMSGALSGSDADAITEERVPSADELAAEIERFLKGRAD